MKIKQFRYSSDNLGYLVYGRNIALAIDGGAAIPILSFIQSNNLILKYIANTHTHPDHTSGNRVLLSGSDAEYLEHTTPRKNRHIRLENEELKVYHTPGHTLDSVSFHFDAYLISGDTIFNGKVGKCFSGDLKSFYRSIKLILELPRETMVYPGHDYVEEYMGFVQRLEPDNKYVDLFLEKYDPGNVYSTLEEEFKINPFIRFNDKKIISLLKKRGLPTNTEYERWKSIMSLH